MGEILVVTLEHPDECPAGEPGDKLYELLQDRPVEGVDVIIGNLAAYSMHADTSSGHPRQVAENLTFADANPQGTNEERRKYELITGIFPNYELIIGHHGNLQAGLDHAFCHEGINERSQTMLALSGMRRVIHHTSLHKSFAALLPNYLGLDLSPDSPLTAAKVREFLEVLVTTTESLKPAHMAHYAYVGELTVTEADQLGLPPYVVPFSRLDNRISKELGYSGELITLCSGKQYQSTGYYAELAMIL